MSKLYDIKRCVRFCSHCEMCEFSLFKVSLSSTQGFYAALETHQVLRELFAHRRADAMWAFFNVPNCCFS